MIAKVSMFYPINIRMINFSLLLVQVVKSKWCNYYVTLSYFYINVLICIIGSLLYLTQFTKTDIVFVVRASLKDSSNKILLLIWRAISTFKAPKNTPIKIFQIRNKPLSSNLKSYFLPLQFIFYYFLLKKKRNIL